MDEHRAAMRRRRIARIDEAAEAARDAGGYDGARGTKTPEMRRLERKVREATNDYARRWRSAAAMVEGVETEVDHVVPVELLLRRLLAGEPAREVLRQADVCTITVAEHRRVLSSLFRQHEPEQWAAMLTCPLSELAALGWERYRRAGIVDCDERP